MSEDFKRALAEIQDGRTPEVFTFEADEEGRTLLHHSLTFNNQGAFLKLLEKAKTEAIALADASGWTVLHQAASLNSPSLIKSILETGAAVVDAQNSGGRTALHYACSRGNVQAAVLLLNAGAKAHFQENLTGETPLHRACALGHIEVVRLMLQQSDAEEVSLIEDKQGRTAAQVALEEGHSEISKLFK